MVPSVRSVVPSRHRLPAWVGVLTAMIGYGVAPLPAQTPEAFNVGVTASTIGGVSRNDARVALDVWAREIASTRGLRLNTSSEFFDTIEEVRAAIDHGRAHLVLLSLEQYLRLQRPEFGDVLVGQRRGKGSDEFLLVTKKGAVARLADLKGSTLQTVDGLDHDMAMVWLESLLHEQGLPPAARHFGAVVAAPKVARGVLPVFFGQAAACLVSRTAFDLMVELNPQIGGALGPLATSPPLVSGVLLLDRKFAAPLRPRLLDALLSLHGSPRGLQVLSLFDVDRITGGTLDQLAPSLELVRQVERVRRSTK